MYTSNCLLNARVYINRLVLFSALATETSLQWAFDVETHRWSTCWKKVIVECPVLNGTLPLPILSRLWEHNGRRGQEECESWRVGRSVMKRCLLDTSALLRLWTLSGYGYLRKIRPGNIQHGWERCSWDSASGTGAVVINSFWNKGSQFSLAVWLL